MTAAGALGCSFARSVVVTLVALAGANRLAGWIAAADRAGLKWRRTAIVALPFMTPNLMVGFGYRGLSLNLLNWPWLNEVIYGALLCLELAPAAAWLLLHAPPPRVSRAAVYCAGLAARQADRRWHRWRWRLVLWRGRTAHWFPAAAVLFVLSFQEAELASLMQVRSWTERLFTEHARGLPALATIRLVWPPALIQLLVVVPLLQVLRREPPRMGTGSELSRRFEAFGGRSAARWPATAWSVIAIVLVTGFPAWHLLRGILLAGRGLGDQPMWFREFGHAWLLATTSGGMAWCSTRAAVRPAAAARKPRGETSRLARSCEWLLAASLIPGLMGTLAIGLVTAATFQRFLPDWAYTPWPLLIAEWVWLWPRAVLVRESLQAQTRLVDHELALLRRSVDARQRRSASGVWWRTTGAGLLGGIAVVWWWSYLELMLPTILAPPGFLPAPMVLYNHLHYGQIATLGVKLALLLAAPATVISLLTVLVSRWTRRISS